jgi:hypothetical protein
MLVFVYSIICMGALSASFLAFFDHEVINSARGIKAGRITALAIFALCWYDPLVISTGYIQVASGIPVVLGILFPIALLGPYFYNTWVVFTDPMIDESDLRFLGTISAKGRFAARKRRYLP